MNFKLLENTQIIENAVKFVRQLQLANVSDSMAEKLFVDFRNSFNSRFETAEDIKRRVI